MASIEKKDIKILEKALVYYERCREFIRHHKDNSLVKDIYSKTNNLIFKYRNIIQDELHIPDFNDSNLEFYEICLSLLVKIEDDFSDLKNNVIDRYKYLVNKKYDEIFSMGEGISEINFCNFSKIYDNYEFAINQNEYLFYEHQLEEIRIKEKENNPNFDNSHNIIDDNVSNIDCKNLSSKFYKKGTFIWICKKVNENIISNYIQSSFRLFIKLFGTSTDDLKYIENLFSFIIDMFFKKINDLVEKNKEFKEIDPIFLKEGLSSFYYPFCESLQKIDNKNMNMDILSEKILKYNEKIINNYLKNYYLNYVLDVAKLFSQTISKIFNNLNQNLKNSQNKNNISEIYNNLLNLFSCNPTSKIFMNNEISITNLKLQHLISQKISIIKKLDISDILCLNEDETNIIYFQIMLTIYEIPFFVIKSFNLYKNDCLDFSIYYSSKERNNLNKEEKENFEFDLINTKKKVKEILSLDKFILEENNTSKKEYEIILLFLFISFIKSQENPKSLNDKFLKYFIPIKSVKKLKNELVEKLENNNKETFYYLVESLIQIYDNDIFKKLKNLFYDLNWQDYENAITFRLPLRDLLIELYIFKKYLMIILGEEAKSYIETKLSTLNEALINKKQRKMTKFQKEMECLPIRRLAIFNISTIEQIYPQNLMIILIINEFVKLKKFNKQGFQQIQLDINLVKFFFRENLIVDVDNILDGFFLEIMNNSSINTKNPEVFDEQLLNEMLDEFKKEFKEISILWEQN